jgi:hypothetical protein
MEAEWKLISRELVEKDRQIFAHFARNAAQGEPWGLWDKGLHPVAGV